VVLIMGILQMVDLVLHPSVVFGNGIRARVWLRRQAACSVTRDPRPTYSAGISISGADDPGPRVGVGPPRTALGPGRATAMPRSVGRGGPTPIPRSVLLLADGVTGSTGTLMPLITKPCGPARRRVDLNSEPGRPRVPRGP
jgi:hypothetical protein